MAINGLKIGQVARGAGVGIDTVRYYERRGLVAEPPRRRSGYRAYPSSAIPRVRFIKRAQELGFSLGILAQGKCPCTVDRCLPPDRDRDRCLDDAESSPPGTAGRDHRRLTARRGWEDHLGYSDSTVRWYRLARRASLWNLWLKRRKRVPLRQTTGAPQIIELTGE